MQVFFYSIFIEFLQVLFVEFYINFIEKEYSETFRPVESKLYQHTKKGLAKHHKESCQNDSNGEGERIANEGMQETKRCGD